MKESFSVVKNMGQVKKLILMAQNTLVILKTIFTMVLAKSFTQMGKVMSANLRKARCMEKVTGLFQKSCLKTFKLLNKRKQTTMVSFKKEKHLVQGKRFGLLVAVMKEVSNKIKDMATALCFG